MPSPRQVGRVVAVAARLPTASWRRLPDFVVIGAQKAGTSTLYRLITAHPDVRPALVKEIHYFDTAPQRSLAWYRAHFPLRDAPGRARPTLTGEASPYYLVHPAVPARMHAVLPDVRVIVILREPVARAVSGYHHARRFGFEHRPIEEALDPATEAEPPDADASWYDSPMSPVRRHGYLVRGRYAEQLERWFAVYPREQVLVLETPQLRAGTAAACAFSFLGLPGAPNLKVTDRNVSAYPPAPREVLDALTRYFAPHNQRLFALLGRRFDWPQ